MEKRCHDNIYGPDFTQFPLARIYIYTRISLLGEKLRKDGKHNTGMMRSIVRMQGSERGIVRLVKECQGV